MKILVGDRKIGGYYLIYRKSEGTFKSMSIFKYESIFGDIWDRTLNKYDWGVETIEGMDGPIMEHGEAITFELDSEEEFRHVTMEMVTLNL
jgi:hypothetical protein